MLDAKTIKLDIERRIRKPARKYLKRSISSYKNLNIEYKEKWRPWKSIFIITVTGSKVDVSYWCRVSKVYFNSL